MDQQTKNNTTLEHFTFVDILKMFRGKLKLLICLALIAALLGAAAGLVLSFLNKEYTAQVNFYLTPGASTQTLLQLLRSESFAEELLLDENGLPEDWDKTDPDYAAALAAIKKESAAREKHIELQKLSDNFAFRTDPDSDKPYERISYNEIKSKYDSLAAEYTRIYNILSVYKNAYSDKIAEQPSHIAETLKYEQMLADAATARDNYKVSYYDPKEEERIKLGDELLAARAALKDARTDSDEAREKLLKKWRGDAEMQELVSAIQASVTYQYAAVVDKEVIKDTVNLEDAIENLNYSFLEISVNIGSDEETAQFIVERIKERSPRFIISNLEKLTGVSEAKCTLISSFAEARAVGNSTSMIKDAVIYGAVSAAAVILVACLIVVTKGILGPDLADKKEKNNKKVPNDQ